MVLALVTARIADIVIPAEDQETAGSSGHSFTVCTGIQWGPCLVFAVSLWPLISFSLPSNSFPPFHF